MPDKPLQMARQRRARGHMPASDSLQQDLTMLDDARGFCNSDRSSRREGKRRHRSGGHGWCPTLLYMSFAGIVILAVAYFLYIGYMETRINTPISAAKVMTLCWHMGAFVFLRGRLVEESQKLCR